jgi:AraC family ethanolamine operon transcriptional activator
MNPAPAPPPPALQTFRFTDVDQFTKALRKCEVRFTPLVRSIAVQQTILNVTGFDIVVADTFPRLVDMQLASNCTAVCFSAGRRGNLRVNGLDLEQLCIGIGQSGDTFSMVEKGGGRLAALIFTPEILNRGWPETRGHFGIYLMTPAAQERLAHLVSEILNFAGEAPDALRLPETLTAIKESLLAAVDQAFQSADVFRPVDVRHLARTFRVFNQVEAAIAHDIKRPIYSGTLASEVGVSVRMLQNVVMQFRGVSLHRYLRLKRLWLVRQRLLAGHTSVKSCALEYGFWHLSDFSRSYQALFGEMPSRTLARAG